MNRKTSLLMYTALIVTVISMVNVSTIASVRASSTPVFVLGAAPTDPLVTDLQALTTHLTILSSISDLVLIGPGSILFVDGTWLANTASIDPTALPTLAKLALTGIPTIVERGNPAILSNSISGLLNFQNPGLPLVAEGLHALGAVTGGIVDGSELRVLSGFDYSVSTEFQWASSQLSQSGSSSGALAPLSSTHQGLRSSITPQDTGTSSWAHVITVITDTNNLFCPYGQVVTTFTVYELQNSGSATYKWFNTFSNQTLIPGVQACTSPTNYRNYNETTFAYPSDQSSNLFVTHGPGTISTSGGTTISYVIGTQQGVLNATTSSTQTMSYFAKNTMITDVSNSPVVSWTHVITGNTAAGKLTLQVVPGWTDRVSQSASLSQQGNLAVTFAAFNGNMVTDTQTTTVSFSMTGG